VRPSVLIVGGFATIPPNYWPFRRRLFRRGAQRVDIAPLWTPDWLIGSMLGLGPILRRTGSAIARTYEMGGRRPIIVIAHSGGGIAARLAMSPQPYHGRVAAVAGAVGCLVTLGTPHGLPSLANRYRHAGHDAVEFLDRVTPGAFFAPRTGYLSVGSAFPSATFEGFVGRLAEQVFAMIVGQDTRAIGDGIVPAAAVHLEGAEQITLDDTRHGMIGAPWYGDDRVIDRWWPTAERLWREALDVRARGRRARREDGPGEHAEPLDSPLLAEIGAKP
jgi:hypothetical protein